MFDGIYKGKKVLITGNTGFKGSWLTMWLLNLGADVVGYSVDIPTKPSMFEELELESKITHYFGDIRDREKVDTVIKTERPDFVFHLAAQPLVSISYQDPLGTISTNALGSANVLDSLRTYDKPCTVVMITTDKCYENVEWVWGYKESDALGGKDVYSSSKAAAEVIIHSYVHSFFDKNHNVRIVSSRAGNVIGGGDWAKNRIIPDTMLAWSKGESVEIRSPEATRPWQHVLEPLSGYLSLAHQLALNPDLHGESFNFGPRSDYSFTVVDILNDLSTHWKSDDLDSLFHITDQIPFHEAGLLKLNCDKALFHLKWMPTLTHKELLRFTGSWYYNYYKGNEDCYEFTSSQIDEYVALAGKANSQWAK